MSDVAEEVAGLAPLLDDADPGMQPHADRVDEAYADVLRCLAVARTAARQAALAEGSTFDAATWVPTAAEVRATASPRAERIARYISIANSVVAYRAEIPQTQLLEMQVEPFELMLQFIGYQRDNFGQIQLKETVENVVGGGFAELPPGFGKTTLEAYIAAAMATPGKKLVLVPSRRIMYQTVGASQSSVLTEAELPDEDDEPFDPGGEMAEGFARFAPHLKLSRYYADEKDQSGDVVVMTYSSFRIAVEKGLINRDDYDAILPDEAHLLMGTITWQRLLQFTQGEMPVLGVTGSGEFSEERRLVDFLRYQICDIEMRDQIDLGLSPPMQLIHVGSETKVKVRRRKGEYTYQELSDLAHDKERNEEIINWVEQLVADGRHVFVPSIAGDHCWHAHHLADLARQRKVLTIDLETEARPIRVAVLDSSMPLHEQDRIHAEWDAGNIDALFTVGMLGLGWSSGLLSAIVDGSPTTSFVVMEQRVGRLTRWGEDRDLVKVYVLITDEFSSHKPPVTPWHVLRESVVDPEKVIGREQNGPGQEKKYDVNRLPTEMAQRLGERFALIDEVLLAKLGDDYRPPDPGWVPIADYHDLWQGLDSRSVRSLLLRHGHKTVLARGRRGPMVHVHEDGIAFLRSYDIPPVAEKNYSTVSYIGPHIGLTYGAVDRLAASLDPPAVPVDLRSRGSGIIRPHYSRADVRRMKQYLRAMRTFLPGDVLVRAVGKEYGLELTSMQLRMRQVDPPVVAVNKITAQGKTATVLDAASAARLRTQLDSEIITDANGRRTLDMLAELTGYGRTKVIDTIADMGLTDVMRRGFHVQSGRVKPAKFLEPAEVERVVERLGYTPAAAAKVIGCDAATLEVLLQSHDFSSDQVQYSTRGNVLKISPAALTQLATLVAGTPVAPPSRATEAPATTWMPIDDVLARYHCLSVTLTHLVAAVHAARSDIRTEAEQTYLSTALIAKLDTYVRRLQGAPDEWMRHTRLAQQVSVSPGELTAFMRKLGLSAARENVRLMRSPDKQGGVELAYAPNFWKHVINTAAIAERRRRL